jgi:hypothetical protein
MTTKVTIHVNGKYKADATVTHGDGRTETHEVHGNYDGSPNPSGEKVIWVHHQGSTVAVSEKQVVD